MASNTDVNGESGKMLTTMGKVVSGMRNMFSPRKEVRGEIGNGLVEEQQAEGHSEGFAEGIGLAFDQKTGTDKPAKGRKIVFYDNLQDLEEDSQGGWFLAKITERVTKKKTAQKQGFKVNYHNVKIEAILQKSGTGTGYIQAQKDGRCINLVPGGLWTVIEPGDEQHWGNEKAEIHLSKFTAEGLNIAETGKPQLVEEANDEECDEEEQTEGGIDEDTSRNATNKVVGEEDDCEVDWDGLDAAGEQRQFDRAAHLEHYLPTYTGADETFERFSTISGWSETTAATARSLQLPLNWEQDHAGKLFIIAKSEDWVRQIDDHRGDTTIDRPAAIKSVKEARELSKSTLRKLFNCGIMSDGEVGIDDRSHMQAQSYWGNKSTGSYMRALITAAKYTIRVRRQLEAICDHAGGFENGLPSGDAFIDMWTGSVYGEPLPSEGIQNDMDFFEQCLVLFRKRYEVEKSGQSMSGDSRASTVLSKVQPVIEAQQSVQNNGQRHVDREAVGVEYITVSADVHQAGGSQAVIQTQVIENPQFQVQQTQDVLGNRVVTNSKLVQQKPWGAETKPVRSANNVIVQQPSYVRSAPAVTRTISEGLGNSKTEHIRSLNGQSLGVADTVQTDRRKTIAGEVAEEAVIKKIGVEMSTRLGGYMCNNQKENLFSDSRNSTPNSTSRKTERKQKEERRREELLDEIKQGVDQEHQWIFELEPENWKERCQREGINWNSASEGMHLSITYLMESTCLPVWASTTQSARELAEVQQSYMALKNTMTEMRRFLEYTPETEDQIKSMLRALDANQTKHMERLQSTVSALIKECTRATNLPVLLTAALKASARKEGEKSVAFISKVACLREEKERRGILLFPTSQTVSQTEDQIRVFSGSDFLTYPEWKTETMAVLSCSGIKRESWIPLILKKIINPAKEKITPEALATKSLQKIWGNLELFYKDSYTVVSMLTRLHQKAGPIADPDVDMKSSYLALKLHNQVLAGLQGFLAHSENEDRYAAVYNLHVCKALIMLLPEKVRRKNSLFIMLTDSSQSTNVKRYNEFHKWITETLASVLQMNADQSHDVLSEVHPVLAAQTASASGEQSDDIKQLLAAQTAMIRSLATKLEETQAKAGNAWSSSAGQRKNVVKERGVKDEPVFCRFCKAICNSNHSANEIIVKINKQSFDDTHDVWTTAYGTKRLCPQNCMSWLQLTVAERKEVVQRQTRLVCRICLGLPNSWNDAQTTCKDRHAITRPMARPGMTGQLCAANGCDYHFTICTEHAAQNKNHHKVQKTQEWRNARLEKFNMDKMGLTAEIIMVLPDLCPDKIVGIDISDSDEVKELARVYEATRYMGEGQSQLSGQQMFFETAAYNNGEEHKSINDVPKEIQQQVTEAIMIAAENFMGTQLPANVTTDMTQFMKDNCDTDNQVVEKRDGDAVLIYFDMEGADGKPIRVVFDSGATICLWTQDVSTKGRLNCCLHPVEKNKTLSGLGGSVSSVTACTVLLPGNVKNNKGQWRNVLACSTLVPQIIPDVETRGMSHIWNKVLEGAATQVKLPQDMVLDNFQKELGGRLEGLIGVKHMDMFPTPVMTLANGLIVYRNWLRPAGSRKRVYTMGGQVKVLKAFQGVVGSNFDTILVNHYDDQLECRNIVFDGDYTDDSLRGIRASQSLDESEHQELQRELVRTLPTNREAVGDQVFRVHASPPIPPELQ